MIVLFSIFHNHSSAKFDERFLICTGGCEAGCAGKTNFDVSKEEAVRVLDVEKSGQWMVPADKASEVKAKWAQFAGSGSAGKAGKKVGYALSGGNGGEQQRRTPQVDH